MHNKEIARSIGFNFRLRFNLAHGRPLPFEERQIVIFTTGDSVIRLASVDSEHISESLSFALIGGPYSSREAASNAADEWRDRLSLAFASLLIAASFGDGTSSGGLLFDRPNPWINGREIARYNDRLGALVYAESPEPVFIGMAASGYAPVQPNRVMKALLSENNLAAMTQEQRLAFDLYSAAQFVANQPTASFMCAMMAIEALITQNHRAPETIEVVEQLVKVLHGSPLRADEKERMLSALKSLKRESIMQAGMRLAGQAGNRTYQGKSAPQFFKECYRIRSQVAHGRQISDTREQLAGRAVALSQLAADLIVGVALRADVRE